MAASVSAAPSTKPKFGSTDICPRCGKAVYFAEQALGPGNTKYHKSCFLRSECNRTLDSSSMAERDSAIFCRSCYGKKFGPKGFGYSGGLSHTT
ncbi:uncharacterized protein BJ171DRAFT_512579 [Polychytrium aggregatum]|uniref:uncharacterized protein n=1 Tax=Polychytrium aggregatum TaxID=110093 RepID=UPI0022FF155F|nr:uncharacterized protein BJ171DRAFT_512579 [Polychytrium aggregatum]KAI9202912.1 hypothetical protein BJ171DRAFT_512579 [Polychytrium aggregatum]